MPHIPERTCIVCRLKDHKKQFFKIVRTEDERVFFDEFGKIDGRSAYICKKFKCLDRALKTKKGDPLHHHLKVKLSEAEKEKLFQEMSPFLDENGNGENGEEER